MHLHIMVLDVYTHAALPSKKPKTRSLLHLTKQYNLYGASCFDKQKQKTIAERPIKFSYQSLGQL